MKTVSKVMLLVAAHQTFWLPVGARALHLEHQYGDLKIWIECDPLAPKEPHTFYVFTEGQKIEDRLVYIGTTRINGAAVACHIFEERLT